MEKCLVTGSCGFVFSNFVRNAILNKCDFELTSVDKVVHERTLHNIYANKSHKFHIGDIADPHFVDVLFAITKPDIVIHGATEFPNDSALFMQSNVMGTQVIVNACIKHKVKKLIYISSADVYGPLGEDQKSSTEKDCLSPRNSYAASKVAGEMIVQAAHYEQGLQYNIVRLCNNFGPRQLTKYFIPKSIDNILNSREVPVFGQGKQTREWLYVGDVYFALMSVINQGASNQIYNVPGYEFSNLEVFHEICNILETGHDLLKFVDDKSHELRYSMDDLKIKELGWKPSVKFKAGLIETCKWYKNNLWFAK